MPNSKPIAAPAEDGLATAVAILSDRLCSLSDRIACFEDILNPVLTPQYPEPIGEVAVMVAPDRSPLTRDVRQITERLSCLEANVVKMMHRLNL